MKAVRQTASLDLMCFNLRTRTDVLPLNCYRAK